MLYKVICRPKESVAIKLTSSNFKKMASNNDVYISLATRHKMGIQQTDNAG